MFCLKNCSRFSNIHIGDFLRKGKMCHVVKNLFKVVEKTMRSEEALYLQQQKRPIFIIFASSEKSPINICSIILTGPEIQSSLSTTG